MSGFFAFAGTHVDMSQNGDVTQGTVGVDVATPAGSVSVDVTGTIASPASMSGVQQPGDMSVDTWSLLRRS